MGKIVAAELTAKLEREITIGFSEIAALDFAARARAYAGYRGADMPDAEARAYAGLPAMAGLNDS